jgi:hypothetical protein
LPDALVAEEESLPVLVGIIDSAASQFLVREIIVASITLVLFVHDLASSLAGEL